MRLRNKELDRPVPPQPFLRFSRSELDFMRGDPFLQLDLPTRIGPVFSPSFDLLESRRSYRLLGDIPGLELENLDIELIAGSLTVTGERDGDGLGLDVSCHAMERCFGSFSRTFALPGPVLGDAYLARMKNGVLTIDIPKLPANPDLGPFPGAAPGPSRREPRPDN
jgi:HSP20 family protein